MGFCEVQTGVRTSLESLPCQCSNFVDVSRLFSGRLQDWQSTRATQHTTQYTLTVGPGRYSPLEPPSSSRVRYRLPFTTEIRNCKFLFLTLICKPSHRQYYVNLFGTFSKCLTYTEVLRSNEYLKHPRRRPGRNIGVTCHHRHRTPLGSHTHPMGDFLPCMNSV